MNIIDENYICGRCGGTLAPIGEEDGLKIYQCQDCRIGRQYECPACHKPRTLMSEEGVCLFCGMIDNFFTRGLLIGDCRRLIAEGNKKTARKG